MATEIELDDVLEIHVVTEDTTRVIVLDPPSRPHTTDDRADETLGSDYVKLWFAAAINNIGDGVRMTALPLLAATFTRNPIAIAGVLFACKLPWLLFSLISGAVVDRVDRRKLMIVTNVLRGVAMGLLGFVVLGDGGGLPLLYVGRSRPRASARCSPTTPRSHSCRASCPRAGWRTRTAGSRPSS